VKVSLGVIGNLAEAMQQEIEAGQAAVKAAMAEASAGLKADWRQQVTTAGLGRRLSNAIRNDVYPKATDSFEAAGVVWSKAPKITAAHEQGVVIRSKDGFWLAIPTDAAPKGLRGRRITPGEYERRTGRRLRFVYRKGRAGLLVDDGVRIQARTGRVTASRSKSGRGQVTAPIFVLIPQARLKKRLDLFAAADTWQARIPSIIARQWDRKSK
jgi:hypothetical protein